MLTITRRTILNLLLLGAWLACAAAPASHAATISWGAAQTDSADTDVANQGMTVRAYTFATANTPTINGVKFTAYEGNAAGDTLTGSITVNNYNGYGGFTGQSTEYKALTTGSYWSNGGGGTFTFNNLTVGQMYEVEVWEQDARSCCGGGRTATLDGAVTLDYNTTGLDGGPGQFAIGTFVANATSQAIAITANQSAQLNGIELRAIPEPASLVLAGLGALCLAACLVNRRMQSLKLCRVPVAKGNSLTTSRQRMLMLLVVGVALACAAAPVSHASTITWSAPTAVVGPADVLHNGLEIEAQYAHGSGSQTVDGVTFSQGFTNYASPANSTTGALTGTTGSAAYDAILNGFAYDGNNPNELTLTGLTTGATYEVQLWALDDRTDSGESTRTEKFGDGAGNYSSTFVLGSNVYVVGTFVANGTTQTIDVQGVGQSQTNLNAFSVQAVPEPSTFLLAGLGAAALLLAARRRVRSKNLA